MSQMSDYIDRVHEVYFDDGSLLTGSKYDDEYTLYKDAEDYDDPGKTLTSKQALKYINDRINNIDKSQTDTSYIDDFSDNVPAVEYFSDEDLENLAYTVIENIEDKLDVILDILDMNMDPDGYLELGFRSQDGHEFKYGTTIDMELINKPSDLSTVYASIYTKNIASKVKSSDVYEMYNLKETSSKKRLTMDQMIDYLNTDESGGAVYFTDGTAIGTSSGGGGKFLIYKDAYDDSDPGEYVSPEKALRYLNRKLNIIDTDMTGVDYINNL